MVNSPASTSPVTSAQTSPTPVQRSAASATRSIPMFTPPSTAPSAASTTAASAAPSSSTTQFLNRHRPNSSISKLVHIEDEPPLPVSPHGLRSPIKVPDWMQRVDRSSAAAADEDATADEPGSPVPTSEIDSLQDFGGLSFESIMGMGIPKEAEAPAPAAPAPAPKAEAQAAPKTERLSRGRMMLQFLESNYGNDWDCK